MKKVSAFLVLCFLLSAVGIGSVSAQSSQTAYIPLLSANYDTSIPRQQLSRNTLDALIPQLLEAKEKGIISSFEPDFYGGFVKLTYASDMNASEFLGIPTYASALEAAVPAPAPITDSQITDAAFNPKAKLSLYSSCFSLSGLVAKAHVKGTISSGTRLTGAINEYADDNGYLWSCFDGIKTEIQPNYTVKFMIYTATDTYLKTITGVIPRFTFTSADQVNAIVNGTGPAGKPFHAYWSQPNLNKTGDYTSSSIDGIIPSTGIWSVDFGTTKMRGDSYVEMTVSINSLLDFETDFHLPSIHCGIGTDQCYMYNLPFKSVSMSITHGGKTYTYSGKTSSWGYFGTQLTNSYGEPIYLAAGDLVSGTSATAYKINALTAVIDSTADKVTGTAPAFVGLYVYMFKLAENSGYQDYVYTDSAGKYTADFSWADIPDTKVLVEVEFINRVTGNVTWYSVMKGF